MDNKLPAKRLMICAAIAAASVVLGYWNLIYSPYYKINEIFQAVLAAAGMTALGEIFAVLSKHPMISYTICAALCSLGLQAITPWNIILPRCTFDKPDVIISAYHHYTRACFVMYSIAFAASILFGVFVLHRNDIFRFENQKTSE